jgi:hypothetical protein
MFTQASLSTKYDKTVAHDVLMKICNTFIANNWRAEARTSGDDHVNLTIPGSDFNSLKVQLRLSSDKLSVSFIVDPKRFSVLKTDSVYTIDQGYHLQRAYHLVDWSDASPTMEVVVSRRGNPQAILEALASNWSMPIGNTLD